MGDNNVSTFYAKGDNAENTKNQKKLFTHDMKM